MTLWRDHFGTARIVVILFGIAHFVADLFGANITKLFFPLLFSFFNFFNLYYFFRLYFFIFFKTIKGFLFIFNKFLSILHEKIQVQTLHYCIFIQFIPVTYKINS